ncbi:MAG: hypothetical protein IT532_04965 [Burkholderiales bacterium]|nr:hypothetical protein [Burkholderiales bacterium]
MSAEDAAKKRLDPTDFQSRFESRYEHQALHEGGTRTLFVPRLEYALSSTLALRLETPYLWNREDGRPYDRGFGDLVVRLNWRALRGDGYALVVGPELSLDTGEKGVGFDMTVFQPVVFGLIDMPSIQSVFFPSVQHFVDIAGKNDVNMSLFRTSLLTRLPNRFYTYFEPSLYVNWRDDNKTAAAFELEIGRVLTSKLAVWVRPGVGIGGNRIPFVPDWNLEIGFRYFLD